MADKSINSNFVQSPTDKHGPGYDNDTPDTWLRGVGENAEGKPNFDRTGNPKGKR